MRFLSYSKLVFQFQLFRQSADIYSWQPEYHVVHCPPHFSDHFEVFLKSLSLICRELLSRQIFSALFLNLFENEASCQLVSPIALFETRSSGCLLCQYKLVFFPISEVGWEGYIRRELPKWSWILSIVRTAMSLRGSRYCVLMLAEEIKTVNKRFLDACMSF